MLSHVRQLICFRKAQVSRGPGHRAIHRQLKRRLRSHHARLTAVYKLLSKEFSRGRERDYERVRNLFAEVARLNRRMSSLARRIRILEGQMERVSRRVDRLSAEVAPIIRQTDEMRRVFLGLEGSVITVVTDAGPVTGTLNLVGTDVIQLTEVDGDIVLIPLSAVNSATT